MGMVDLLDAIGTGWLACIAAWPIALAPHSSPTFFFGTCPSDIADLDLQWAQTLFPAHLGQLLGLPDASAPPQPAPGMPRPFCACYTCFSLIPCFSPACTASVTPLPAL